MAPLTLLLTASLAAAPTFEGAGAHEQVVVLLPAKAPDPGFNMAGLRAAIEVYLSDIGHVIAPIPREEASGLDAERAARLGRERGASVIVWCKWSRAGSGWRLEVALRDLESHTPRRFVRALRYSQEPSPNLYREAALRLQSALRIALVMRGEAPAEPAAESEPEEYVDTPPPEPPEPPLAFALSAGPSLGLSESARGPYFTLMLHWNRSGPWSQGLAAAVGLAPGASLFDAGALRFAFVIERVLGELSPKAHFSGQAQLGGSYLYGTGRNAAGGPLRRSQFLPGATLSLLAGYSIAPRLELIGGAAVDTVFQLQQLGAFNQRAHAAQWALPRVHVALRLTL